MNVETSLVSKLVQTGALEKAIAREIEPHHFEDSGSRTVYEILLNHTHKYKVPPSPDAVVKEIKAIEKRDDTIVNFTFEVSQDALDYLIDKFVGLIKYRATVTAVRDLAAKTKDQDNWEHLDLDALEIARNLAMIVPSSQISRLSDVQKRIEAYEKRKLEGNPWGVKTGIPTLDLLTLGIQPHELVTIAGWMGLGKSTLMQYMLWNAYLQDKKPMLISMEMEAEALFRKWDTMSTNMSYTALKAMKLGKGDMKKWSEWGQKAADAKAERDIVVVDDIGKCTVDKVFAETLRHSPDLVAIDYVGLMDAPSNVGSHWEKVTYCTKGLKFNARKLMTPHIVVAQTNREDGGKGAELDNLAGSLSIGRDSDQVYGLYQDEEMKEGNVMEVRLIKSRDSGAGKAIMNWKPETMEFKERSLADAFT